MKTYEQCFTAMHAVDITLKHLSHSDSYSSKAVNRHMAVKVSRLFFVSIFKCNFCQFQTQPKPVRKLENNDSTTERLC